jgi:hypothetical protein
MFKNQHEKFHIHIQIQPIQLRIQKLELHHLPFNDMQSYDIQKKNYNIIIINETNIYSPLHIKNVIKEKYKLNNL